VIPAFRLACPDVPVIELPKVGHFSPEDAPETLPEDAPETLVALLQPFLQTSGRA
jgi:hypothetical protein